MKDADFEWDNNKAASNIRKHQGVSFPQACAVFRDTFAIQVIDDREVYLDLNGEPEERLNIVGLDAAGTLLVVTYTWRGRRRRIITAQKVDGNDVKAIDYYRARQQF